MWPVCLVRRLHAGPSPHHPEGFDFVRKVSIYTCFSATLQYVGLHGFCITFVAEVTHHLFDVQSTEVHFLQLNLSVMFCQMWMLRWCLFYLLCTFEIVREKMLLTSNLTINILFDVSTWWYQTAKPEISKKVVLFKIYPTVNLQLSSSSSGGWSAAAWRFSILAINSGGNKMKTWMESPCSIFLVFILILLTFSRVEHTVGLSVADIATLGFAVML